MTIFSMAPSSDCLLPLGITPYHDGNETVSSVACKGDALSLVGIAQRFGQGGIDTWSLATPDVGTHDVDISFDSELSRNAAARVTAFAESIRAIHQAHSDRPEVPIIGRSGINPS